MQGIKIIDADARSLPIDDNSVNLIITDPPYQATSWTAYSSDPKSSVSNYSSIEEYEKNIINSFKEMTRVLKDNGSIFFVTGWSLIPGPFSIGTSHLSLVEKVTKECGLILRSSIIWKNGHTPELEATDGIIKNNTQTIYHLSKNYDIKYVPYYFSRYNYPIWECPMEYQEEFGQHPVWMLPDEICSRLIKMYTVSGDTVLDPFGGAGTVAIVAKNLGRLGISVDCIPEQNEIARKRSSISYIV